MDRGRLGDGEGEVAGVMIGSREGIEEQNGMGEPPEDVRSTYLRESEPDCRAFTSCTRDSKNTVSTVPLVPLVLGPTDVTEPIPVVVKAFSGFLHQ